MTLEPGEFMRRFLMHVLPKGFHRIRHYGLLANGGATRAEKLARARQLIAAAAQIDPSTKSPHDDGTCEDMTLSEKLDHPCPHCGSRMLMIETFEAGSPASPSPFRARVDNQHQHVMTCAASSRSPCLLSAARICRPRSRTPFSSFPHPICHAISRTSVEITPPPQLAAASPLKIISPDARLRAPPLRWPRKPNSHSAC